MRVLEIHCSSFSCARARKIVLHSFAHLSDSKSSQECALDVLKTIEERLKTKGYEVFVTPFGYFLELKLHVLGESLAKVWKALS